METFISEHPGFTLWILGGVLSSLVGLIALFHGIVARRLSSLEAADKELAERVQEAEVTLEKYQEHVGAGDKILSQIQGALRDHVEREEQIFWKKVDAISDAQRISNEAVLQRVTAIEARMPNGELQALMKSMVRVEAVLEVVKEEARSAIAHVKEHNAEAEDWKRRIVGLEARFSPQPTPRRK